MVCSVALWLTDLLLLLLSILHIAVIAIYKHKLVCIVFLLKFFFPVTSAFILIQLKFWPGPTKPYSLLPAAGTHSPAPLLAPAVQSAELVPSLRPSHWLFFLPGHSLAPLTPLVLEVERCAYKDSGALKFQTRLCCCSCAVICNLRYVNQQNMIKKGVIVSVKKGWIIWTSLIKMSW